MPVDGTQVQRFGPGEAASEFEPGDFILTHARHFVSRCIRLGQRLRQREYAYWSHAAVIVDPEGTIVEAETKGVQKNHLEKYRDIEYHLVRLGDSASPEDRRQVVAYALSRLGEPFGFLTMASIGFSCITGARLTFGRDSHEVCSGLVARALERTWAIFELDPEHMLPADLAKAYSVRPPRPGA